jgi:hypothetical protein
MIKEVVWITRLFSESIASMLIYICLRRLSTRVDMKRFLSHIILFTLLSISPISFSSIDIPDFNILVTFNSPTQESRKNSITVAHQVVQPMPLAVDSHPTEQCFTSLPTLPAHSKTSIIEHGRAPPVVRSV